jgi:signal-transduction protein with cAMP-binding, CBS, and nucleotidyltransferase domain
MFRIIAMLDALQLTGWALLNCVIPSQWEQLRVVSPEAPVMQALETMARENINQLPVVSDGHLEGILSRAHLLEILRTRSQLKV